MLGADGVRLAMNFLRDEKGAALSSHTLVAAALALAILVALRALVMLR